MAPRTKKPDSTIEGETSDAGKAGVESTQNTLGKYPSELALKPGELKVIFQNNSVSGHELLRENGDVLAIIGHGKVEAITTKEELVAITAELASKPWIEINVESDVDESEAE